MVKKLRNKLKNGIIQRFRSKSVKYRLFFLLYSICMHLRKQLENEYIIRRISTHYKIIQQCRVFLTWRRPTPPTSGNFVT